MTDVDDRELRKQRRLIADYKRTFETDTGKRVFRDLLIAAGFARVNYVPGSFDQTAYNEGQRALVLRIAKLLQMTEADLAAMLTQPNTEDM